MRTTSVAVMQGRTSASADHALPSPGTDARALYDRLRANAGHIVTTDELADLRAQIGHNNRIGMVVTVLRDFYGCDIRAKRGRKSWLMLAGEYVGKNYVDYCAAEFEKGS